VIEVKPLHFDSLQFYQHTPEQPVAEGAESQKPAQKPAQKPGTVYSFPPDASVV
jgi:hypothetical protein